MIANEEWTSRQESSEEARRTHESERLLLWTTDAISELMTECELSKADMARKLGTSRAYITQVLSGSRNATLNTISDFAWACGKRAVVKFEPLRTGEFISSPVKLVGGVRPRVVALRSAPTAHFDGDAGAEYLNIHIGAM